MTSSYLALTVEDRASVFPGSVSDGMVSYSADLHATSWNASMEKLTGLSAHEAIGRPLSELLPALFEFGDEEHLRAAIRGQIGVTTPHERVDTDGIWRTLERQYSPLPPQTVDGMPGGLLVIRDVSGAGSERSLRCGDDELLRATVRQLADGYGAQIGFVGEFSSSGEMCWSAIYDAAGPGQLPNELGAGPCQRVYTEGISYYPSGLHKLYPTNSFLQERRIESYLAMPLVDRSGTIVGHIGVMHDAPLAVENLDLLRTKAFTVARMLEDRNQPCSPDTSRLRAEHWIVDEERARQQIAADLHDYIGQNLLSAKIKLDQLAAAVGDDKLGEVARECRSLVEEAVLDTRSLIFEISPPLLLEEGFEAALEWLAEQLSTRWAMRIDVQSFQWEAPQSQEVISFLFRAVRELLINAAKHGSAKQARVNVLQSNREVQISVEDDGCGFCKNSNTSGGFGLHSIRQRLHLLGGQLLIDSSAGHGSVVVLRMPSSR